MVSLLGHIRLIQHMPERVAKADRAVVIEHGNRLHEDIAGIARQELLALLCDAQHHRAGNPL